MEADEEPAAQLPTRGAYQPRRAATIFISMSSATLSCSVLSCDAAPDTGGPREADPAAPSKGDYAEDDDRRCARSSQQEKLLKEFLLVAEGCGSSGRLGSFIKETSAPR